MGFPEQLIKLRYEHGISQAKLAKALGCSQSSINYWEKGQRTPSAEALKKIADYFNVTLAEMMGIGHISEQGLEVLDDVRASQNNTDISFEDMTVLIARNGRTLTKEQKLQLIKLLSELE